MCIRDRYGGILCMEHLSPTAREMIARAREQHSKALTGASRAPLCPRHPNQLEPEQSNQTEGRYSWSLPDLLVKEHGEARRQAQHLRSEWQRARQSSRTKHSPPPKQPSPSTPSPSASETHQEPFEQQGFKWNNRACWSELADIVTKNCSPPPGHFPSERWENFIQHANSSQVLGLSDIPFPTEIELGLQARRAMGSSQRERAMKHLVLRWHPDKFFQKFGSKLRPCERDQILDRVNQVFMWIQNYRTVPVTLQTS
eukprot:TRINITY_DN44446_c0_g2_i1.p1 TRINITY_DN44446_c0_g2~~TRINITY_DN44446_c0_g2_i1.p1  ORF type:complete len:256 (+),score=34.05 TRINITY_DN44446_c0_g2_i1:121-888(+)